MRVNAGGEYLFKKERIFHGLSLGILPLVYILL